jgi:hypothetical protein
MNEVLLISLLKLFANINAMHSEVMYAHTKSFIEKLLRKDLHLQKIDYYLNIFHEFYEEYVNEIKELPNRDEKRVVLKTICSSISSDLPLKERISIVVYLLQLIKYYQINHFKGYKTDDRLQKTIDHIAANFCIKTEEYQSLCEFVFENLYQIHDNKNLLIVGRVNIFTSIKFIKRERLKGQIYFLFMPSVKTLMFYYNGEENIELNSNQIFPLTIYLFKKSSVISSQNISPIYYHEVIEYYLEDVITEPIHF